MSADTSAEISLEPQRTALLVMDYQPEIVARLPSAGDLLQRTSEALAACRQARVPIIFVAVGFRPGSPEISDCNPMFAAAKAAGRFAGEWPNAQIHPRLERQPEEILVVKHRVSAFTGTDLEMILRAQRIETLVLAGIATSGVVLSTVRHAADADYRLIVLRDCCADSDDDVHRCLIEKVFPKQTNVIPAADFLRML